MKQDPLLTQCRLTKDDVHRLLSRPKSLEESTAPLKKRKSPKRRAKVNLPNMTGEVPRDLLEYLPRSAILVFWEEFRGIMSRVLCHDERDALEKIAASKAILMAFLSLEAHQNWGDPGSKEDFPAEKTVLNRLLYIANFETARSQDAFAALVELGSIPDILTAPPAHKLFQFALEQEADERYFPEGGLLANMNASPPSHVEALTFLPQFMKAQMAGMTLPQRQKARSRFIRWSTILGNWRNKPAKWKKQAKEEMQKAFSNPYDRRSVDRDKRALKPLVTHYVKVLHLDLGFGQEE